MEVEYLLPLFLKSSDLPPDLRILFVEVLIIVFPNIQYSRSEGFFIFQVWCDDFEMLNKILFEGFFWNELCLGTFLFVMMVIGIFDTFSASRKTASERLFTKDANGHSA